MGKTTRQVHCASAPGRKFVRISLGGMHYEAEFAAIAATDISVLYLVRSSRA